MKSALYLRDKIHHKHFPTGMHIQTSEFVYINKCARIYIYMIIYSFIMIVIICIVIVIIVIVVNIVCTFIIVSIVIHVFIVIT